MDIKRSQNIGGVGVNLGGVSDSKKAQQAKNAYEGKAADNVQKKNGVNVNLSEAAKQRSEQFKTAFDIAKNTSPIREDRVAEIRAKIENGTYAIDAGKIADGMLMEAAKDEISTKLY